MKTSTLKKAIPGTRFGFLILTLIFLLACGGSKSTADNEDFNQLKELVGSREFEIQHQWARSSLGGSINLIGNPNFIRFKGDSVNIFLPYFGERYSGSGYGSEGGIKYKGPVKNLNVTTHKEEQELILEFEGDRGTENLQFYITLFANGDASTSVTSSQREAISYSGQIMPLREERNE